MPISFHYKIMKDLLKINKDYDHFIKKWPRDHPTGNHWYWKRVKMTYHYKILNEAGLI